MCIGLPRHRLQVAHSTYRTATQLQGHPPPGYAWVTSTPECNANVLKLAKVAELVNANKLGGGICDGHPGEDGRKRQPSVRGTGSKRRVAAEPILHGRSAKGGRFGGLRPGLRQDATCDMTTKTRALPPAFMSASTPPPARDLL